MNIFLDLSFHIKINGRREGKLETEGRRKDNTISQWNYILHPGVVLSYFLKKTITFIDNSKININTTSKKLSLTNPSC